MTRLWPRSILAASIAMTGLIMASWARAEPLGQGHDISIPWFRLVSGLGFCILLAYGGALVIRSRQADNPLAGKSGSGLHGLAGIWIQGFGRKPETGPADMKIVQTLMLGNRVEIVLLELAGRRLLVATSPSGPAVLLSTTDKAE